jgi:hypothetical protein
VVVQLNTVSVVASLWHGLSRVDTERLMGEKWPGIDELRST